jgi:excisionase family DNA binding protein
MLTTFQAAEQLGISPDGVRKLVARGQLRAASFGRDLSFDPRDIERAKSRRRPGRPTGKRKRPA